MLEMTKKQGQAIELALRLIKNREIGANQREWDSLFEDGYNNTNSIHMELLERLEDDLTLCRGIVAQDRFMPDILLKAAKYTVKYYWGDDLEDDLLTPLLDKLKDLNREITLFDKKITNDDFDYIYRYYVTPLAEVHE